MKVILLCIVIAAIGYFAYQHRSNVDPKVQKYADMLEELLPKTVPHGGRREAIEITSDGKGIVVPLAFPSSSVPSKENLQMKQAGSLVEQLYRKMLCVNGRLASSALDKILKDDRYILFEIKVDGVSEVASFDVDEDFCRY